jgi:hypothetical protein
MIDDKGKPDSQPELELSGLQSNVSRRCLSSLFGIYVRLVRGIELSLCGRITLNVMIWTKGRLKATKFGNDFVNTTESSSLRTDGPGSDRVGVPGIVLILSCLVALAALLFYILIVLLPIPSSVEPPTTTGDNAASAETIRPGPFERDVILFGLTWKISDEERLLILVMTAGALGSLVHALRSAYWYVGNRNLVRSWIPKYLLLPFCGAILAVLFYFVVRGGFFSPRANSMDTSQYGFCALACLVGLFSEQAVLKLKQVAETVFMTTEQGKDANPPSDEGKPKA